MLRMLRKCVPTIAIKGTFPIVDGEPGVTETYYLKTVTEKPGKTIQSSQWAWSKDMYCFMTIEEAFPWFELFAKNYKGFQALTLERTSDWRVQEKGKRVVE